MKSLPLVHEISLARAACEEANRATLHAAKVDSALLSVSVLRGVVERRQEIVSKLPGADIMTELVSSWSALAPLAQSNPDPASKLIQQLAVRQGQLELARAHLRPVARDGQARASALHELQHRQRHTLEDPEWAQDVALLAGLGAERTELADALAPVDQKVAMLQPANQILAVWIARLRDAAQEAEGDAHLAAWRAASLAHGLLHSLDAITRHVDLEIPLPTIADLPSSPTAYNAQAMRDQVAAALQQLSELDAVMQSRHNELADEQQRLRSRYDAVTAIIVERMG